LNRLLVLTELFLPTKGVPRLAAEVYKRLGGKEIHIVTAVCVVLLRSMLSTPTHPPPEPQARTWLRPESLACTRVYSSDRCG